MLNKTAALVVTVACVLEVYTLGVAAPDRLRVAGRHRTTLPEFGRGVVIEQSFTPKTDGLREVRLRVRAGRAAEGELEWTLSALRADGAWEKVLSARRRARFEAGEHWHALRFPDVEHSAARVFQLHLRLSASGAEDVALVASYDDAHRAGALTVGTEERWGDLVFDTRATGDTAFGRFSLRVAPELAPPFRAPSVWVVIVAALSLVLATFAHDAMRATGVPVERTATFPPAARSRVAGAIAIIALFAAAIGAVAIRPREERALSLLSQLHRARFEAPRGLHWTFHLTDATVAGVVLPALYAHSPNRFTVPVRVEGGARLRAGIAIEEGAWGFAAGDGVSFTIVAQDTGRATRLFARHIDPTHQPPDRIWVPVDVDLSPFAGRDIDLVFVTEPSRPGAVPNGAYDWALWGAPRITGPRNIR